MDRRSEDVELDADVKDTLCRQVFEVTSYFEVLVVSLGFFSDARKPGLWHLVLGLSCDMGEKDCEIPFYPTAQGLDEAARTIRQLVGDWTV